MVPYAVIIGGKYTFFIAHHYQFIENDKIEEGTLLNSPGPIDYHVGKRGKDVFKKLKRSLIHVFWSGVGEDIENENDVSDVEVGDLIETEYPNGNNEVVENFIQKCVICLPGDSDYASREKDHQCICEQCYQNKGVIDILKSVVCRT